MATVYDTSIELNNVVYAISGIDVGNSRVKIHHDGVSLSFPYDKEWKKNVQHHFRDHVDKRYLIGMSSVNPKQSTAIVKVLQRIPGHLVVNIHKLLMGRQDLLKLGDVENAGLDRLLGAIGALSSATPPLITVDCGTAITVNAISADRTFLGGVIFAGLSTQLFGLFKQTSGVPEYQYQEPTTVLGSGTREAVMAGVTASAVGGVSQAIAAIRRQYFADAVPHVVVSGGEGSHLMKGLEANGIAATYNPHIVTHGAMQLLAEADTIAINDAIIEKIR
ncbi:MAG: type III pantothenate kinase [Candidatus Kapaibacteriota bacterium]